MATTDARLSVGLASHPKTKKLIRRLGGDAAWRLVCLLLWCAANRPDGSLAGMSDEDIELAVDWDGDDGALVAAMCDVGFLDGDEGSRSVHDWEEHNPWAAGSDARSEKGRWAALCKQYGRREAARRMPEYAQRIGAASQEDAPSNHEQSQIVPVAVPESASGVPVAESSSAPLPSPIPYPSPYPKEEEKHLSTSVDLAGAVPPPKPPSDVDQVFDHWREVMSSPRSQLDQKRTKVIKGALKAGYSVGDLQRAISGCAKTPHNMGKNDRHQKFNGIDLILRNADQIDRFIANDGGNPAASDGREDLGDGRYRREGRIYGADGRPEVVL